MGESYWDYCATEWGNNLQNRDQGSGESYGRFRRPPAHHDKAVMNGAQLLMTHVIRWA
jgi:hypothetical protein